jgi:hypothetical protein
MRKKVKCGAYARSTGNPCQAKALPNGRCKNHGGLKLLVPKHQRAAKRLPKPRASEWPQEAVYMALEGFYRWLEGGGREMLSRLAKDREKRKRWKIS